jgi:hypothetical protein
MHAAGGARGFAGGAHYAGVGHAGVYAAGGYGGRVGAYGGYGHGYAGYGRGYGGYHGYSTGAYWRGGYWGGGFWPAAFYGAGFAWFLPVLPYGYATYWYAGVPYYYANDVYYTWDPSYDGYVATDPPPVSGGAAAAPPADGSAAPQSAPQAPASATAAALGGQLYMYPKNGQSDEQQSTDRRECQQWAASQAGANGSQANDYRRAMMACVEGRGYSVQ